MSAADAFLRYEKEGDLIFMIKVNPRHKSEKI